MIGRKATLTLLNMFVGSVLGFAATKLIALYFTTEEVGQFGYALGLLGLAFFVTDFGMGQAHVKRVSEGRDPGDCFATFAVFKAAATGVFALMVLGGMFVYLVILHKPLEDTNLTIVLVVLVYYIAKGLQDIGQSSFDARLETARSQLATFTDTSVRVGLTAVGALLVAALARGSGPLLTAVDPTNPAFRWMAQNPGAVLAVATAAGGVAAAALALSMLARNHERGRFRWDLLRDYATFAFPLFVTTSIGIISSNVDSVTLGFFGSAGDVGLFTNVKKLPVVLVGIGTAVTVLLFPALSSLAAQGDRAAMARTTNQALRYLGMLVVPMVVFTVVFAPQLIHLGLSDQYISGTTTLQVLAVYVLFIILAGPHGSLVLGIGRSADVAKVSFATAAALITLDLVLIPDDIKSLGIRLAGLHVLGAAIATLVSGLVFYAGLRYLSYRRAQYRQRSDLPRQLLAALIMVGALMALDRWALPLARGYELFAFVVFGAAVYLGALVALRGFNAEDWELVRASVHPMEMVRYVRGELRKKRR